MRTVAHTATMNEVDVKCESAYPEPLNDWRLVAVAAAVLRVDTQQRQIAHLLRATQHMLQLQEKRAHRMNAALSERGSNI
jgi:hypothetical protein